MKSRRNPDYIITTSIFNSLDVNRKLFCNYLKEYANKKNQYLTNDAIFPEESEDSLLSHLDELLMESIIEIRKIEPFVENQSNNHSIHDSANLRDEYINWKNDLVLRVVVLRNLARMDTLDLQRAMFICLDSPYVKSLTKS